jgi:SAM-dependent methyltransferase
VVTLAALTFHTDIPLSEHQRKKRDLVARQYEDDLVARQYKDWVYPQPIQDISEFVKQYYDLSDPSLFRRKLWPRKIEPENLSILIAGCGANQAAHYAFTNRNSHVLGIDVSDSSLGHEAYLKQRHRLDNLELLQMSLGEIGSLGRSFDLIVCTGVLHHLPDPDASLRCLRDVLKPHGVISIMLYGSFPRVGVYMLQEVFRLLGLKQDVEGIGVVKRAIDLLPKWHYLNAYRQIAPDLGYDSGLVDTFLHSADRAFTVPQILKFVEDNDLTLQSWLDKLKYSLSATIGDPHNSVRKLAETLPVANQWEIVELMGQSVARHNFLLCHPEKDKRDYILDFSGDEWIDYIPSRRHPLAALPTSDGTRASRPLVIHRLSHSVALDTFEAAMFEQVDGSRTIRDILRTVYIAKDSEDLLSVARRFFGCMADWDHLQFEIP